MDNNLKEYLCRVSQEVRDAKVRTVLENPKHRMWSAIINSAKAGFGGTQLRLNWQEYEALKRVNLNLTPVDEDFFTGKQYFIVAWDANYVPEYYIDSYGYMNEW